MSNNNADLQKIITKLQGTREEEILRQMQELYSKIADAQSKWYKKSGFTCPQGCGECCRNFEPDLLDCEALYMAAWLLENQEEIASQLIQGNFPFPDNKGCPFWNEEVEYHCSIYGGRPFICRFFGACASKSKEGQLVFKPCKFYPEEKLTAYNSLLSHRQYSQDEVEKIFGALPPVMSNIMEKAISLNPENQKSRMLRDILPATIKHLKWIYDLA